MGFKSCPKGVKKQLIARFPQAFQCFPSLIDTRLAVRTKRDETIIVLDGNVMLMSVPQSAKSLDEFVQIVFSSLYRAIVTANVTVVVFDHPGCLTAAKKAEQSKRDASQQQHQHIVHSEDMIVDENHAHTDDYTVDYLESLEDLHPLVKTRASRLRLFDEVTMRAFRKLENNLKWSGGHLLLDGIDPLGAARAPGETRNPQIVSSSIEVGQLFRRTIQIGEGDLLLSYVGQKARQLASEGVFFDDYSLVMTCTIDTDSFAIEIMV